MMLRPDTDGNDPYRGTAVRLTWEVARSAARCSAPGAGPGQIEPDAGHGSPVENVELLNGNGHASDPGVREADIGDIQRQRFKKIDVLTGGHPLDPIQQAIVGNNG